MRKEVCITAFILLIITSLSLCLSGCGNNSPKFSGSKTGNDNQFLADFDVLNTTISNSMPLKSGDTINTEIDIKKGKVDILVKSESGTVAYRGDKAASGNFSIGIIEDGLYTFSITGSKAKGSVHFVKAEK